MRHVFPPWKQEIRNTCCSQQASWVRLEIPCISTHALIWQRLFYKLLQICKWWIHDENVTVVDKSHSEDIKITAVSYSLNLSSLSWLKISQWQRRAGFNSTPQSRRNNSPLYSDAVTTWAGVGIRTCNGTPTPLLRRPCWTRCPASGCCVRYYLVASAAPRFGDSHSTHLGGAEVLQAQLKLLNAAQWVC